MHIADFCTCLITICRPSYPSEGCQCHTVRATIAPAAQPIARPIRTTTMICLFRLCTHTPRTVSYSICAHHARNCPCGRDESIEIENVHLVCVCVCAYAHALLLSITIAALTAAAVVVAVAVVVVLLSRCRRCVCVVCARTSSVLRCACLLIASERKASNDCE